MVDVRDARKVVESQGRQAVTKEELVAAELRALQLLRFNTIRPLPSHIFDTLLAITGPSSFPSLSASQQGSGGWDAVHSGAVPGEMANTFRELGLCLLDFAALRRKPIYTILIASSFQIREDQVTPYANAVPSE